MNAVAFLVIISMRTGLVMESYQMPSMDACNEALSHSVVISHAGASTESATCAAQ